MTPDESLLTKQTVVLLNFNCNFNPTVPVLKKIFQEPRNMTNDKFRLFCLSTKTTENNIAAKIKYHKVRRNVDQEAAKNPRG